MVTLYWLMIGTFCKANAWINQLHPAWHDTVRNTKLLIQFYSKKMWTPQTMASKEFTEYQTGDCIAEIAAGELRNLLLNSYFLVRYLFKPHFQSISDFLQLLWHPHFFTIELNQQLSIANSIMPRWMQLVDPGIGFAKGANHKPAKSHHEQYA